MTGIKAIDTASNSLYKVITTQKYQNGGKMAIVISILRDGRRRIECSYFTFAGLFSGHAYYPSRCAT